VLATALVVPCAAAGVAAVPDEDDAAPGPCAEPPVDGASVAEVVVLPVRGVGVALVAPVDSVPAGAVALPASVVGAPLVLAVPSPLLCAIAAAGASALARATAWMNLLMELSLLRCDRAVAPRSR
jgi:hypothetical protein